MCRFLIVWKWRNGCLAWCIVFTKYTGSSIIRPIVMLIFRSTFSVIGGLYYNRCLRLPQPPVHLLAVCVDGDNLPNILSKEATWQNYFSGSSSEMYETVLPIPSQNIHKLRMVWASYLRRWCGCVVEKENWNDLKMSHWDLTGKNVRPALLQYTYSYKHLL